MCLNVGQFMPAIGVDPLRLLVPAVAELADCAGHQARQIAHDEPRVLAGNFDLTGKGVGYRACVELHTQSPADAADLLKLAAAADAAEKGYERASTGIAAICERIKNPSKDEVDPAELSFCRATLKRTHAAHREAITNYGQRHATALAALEASLPPLPEVWVIVGVSPS